MPSQKLLGLVSLVIATLLIWTGFTMRPKTTSHRSNPSSIADQLSQEQPPSSVGTATSTQKKLIALTFDDGPYGTSTRQILDILKKENIHATFFVIGQNVLEFPEEVRREIQEGNIIGNHSFNHSKRLPKMTAEEFKIDLDRTEEIIASSTGIRPKLYRPPYGALSTPMRDVLAQEGYRTSLWNVDPNDWDYAHSPSDKIIHSVLDAVKPNSIVLFHDGRDTQINYPRDNTVTALPIIIEALKAQGYSFVTLDALRK